MRIHKKARRITHHIKKFHRKVYKKFKETGFTLVELLVAIGIVAALSGSIIAVINPKEQLSRSQDSVRKAHIAQIGKALKRYSIQNTTFPNPSIIAETLTASGELINFPTNPSAVSYNCNSVAGQGAQLVNGYCVNTATALEPPGAVVYAPMISTKETDNCSGGATWIVWSAAIGTSGRHCTSNSNEEPEPSLALFVSTLDVPAPTGSAPTETPTLAPLPTNTPIPIATPTNTPIILPTSTPTTAPTATPTLTPSATPTPTTSSGPIVILNSASGTNCNNICTNNGRTCISVGYDADGINGQRMGGNTGQCATGSITCTTNMPNINTVCNGIPARYTYCRCQ
jgi:prepilin-type N-terminal cleavage/methylation domain-containing protein